MHISHRYAHITMNIEIDNIDFKRNKMEKVQHSTKSTSGSKIPDNEYFYSTFPYMIAGYRPVKDELYVENLEITEGKIPDGLNGVLYRNMSNLQFPPLEHHHWFFGEGMVHAVFVKDGKVAYRNRYVETEQYKEQKKAGKRLIPAHLLKEAIPEEGKHILPHYASTHAIYHGGVLLALGEWNKAAAMTGETLDTISDEWDFKVGYDERFTAHPKLDGQTGELFGFAYQVGGTGSKIMSYNVVAPDGKMTRNEQFEVPYCPIAHDFGITKEHIIFPFFSASIDMERAMVGGPLAMYDPDLPVSFLIIDREKGVESKRWFKGSEDFYAYHTMNSFTSVNPENGHKIVTLDMMKFPHVPVFPHKNGKTPAWIKDGNALLVRWTFDLDGDDDGYEEEVITDLEGEFPVVDPRYVGLPYKHGFYVGSTGEWVNGAFFDTVCHVNVETKERKDYYPGKGEYFMEPVFVPRTEDAEEGDGWLVTISYVTSRDASDFLVFDTKVGVDKGPIARVELPGRVPYGFHGSWRSI